MSEDVGCVIVLRSFLCCGLILLVRVDHTDDFLESDLCLMMFSSPLQYSVYLRILLKRGPRLVPNFGGGGGGDPHSQLVRIKEESPLPPE